MTQPPGSFRPSELEGADGQPGDAEMALAWSTARELETALPPETVVPSAGFADRVMAAVALEPAPRPTGFLDALRGRPGLAGLIASVREAWSVVGGGPGRPARARGFALAYVLAVLVAGVSLTGAAAYGAAGALGLFDASPSPTPSVVPSISPSPEPSPTPTPPEIMGSPEPTDASEPTETPEPQGTDDNSSATPKATAPATPKASDDHGGASPSPSDDDESSGGSSNTPRPSDTPRPSQTPD
jgi:hypothetical protein